MKKMKKLLLVALMGVCGSIFYSCGEKDEDPVVIPDVPEIKLTGPTDGASINLQTVSNVPFQWTAVPEITAYVLKLSATQNLQNATEIDAAANPFMVPATRLNTELAALGVASGGQKTIYWSIAPKDAATVAKTETRSLTLTRISAPTIALTAPEQGVTVTTVNLPLVFTWTKSNEVANTVISISTDETFPVGNTTIVGDAITALSHSLTADAYESLLAAAGVDYGATVTVHWKVEPSPANADVVTYPASFIATRRAQSAIVLTPTAETIDANEIAAAPTFAWTKITEVTDYTIKFALDDAFTSPEAYSSLGDVNSYTFASIDAYNTMLTTLGVTEPATVWWTVAPATANPAVAATAPGSFTATAIVWLKSPAAGAKIILSNDLSGNIDISWNAKADATAYKVIVSKNANLSNALLEQDETGTSLTLTEAQVQALIADAPKGLKRYKKNELYWGVKDNSGNLINDEIRPLTLYGQRIYVDDRKSAGTETYPVAVIEYNGKEVVWMAEDLRATRFYNSDMTTPTRTDGERATYDNGDGSQPLPEKYLNRTNPPVGKYYDGPYLVNFIPRGHNGDGDSRLWKIPTTEEWNELFAAAWATFGNDNALRHPDFLQDPGNTDHANEWGMNMVPNGYFSYYGSGTHQIWYDSRIYYQNYNTIGGEGSTATIYEYNYWGAGDGNYGSEVSNGSNGNNIRCIYTGDDN